MEIKLLYNRLLEAYSLNNLNSISSKLINSYKSRDFKYIRKINKIHSINESSINKLFSKLILLYHPDKLNFFLNDIKQGYDSKDIDKLNKYGLIFKIINYKENDDTTKTTVREKYREYKSKYDNTDSNSLIKNRKRYKVTDVDEYTYEDVFETEPDSYNFIDALKLKEYGNLKVRYEYHHLEEIDGELEISGYNLRELSGVEYCINVTSLNLSNNNIDDISLLANLGQLEELDLSYNEIDDLSSLFELENLVFLNVIGNEISQKDINHLRKNGVIVIY